LHVGQLVVAIGDPFGLQAMVWAVFPAGPSKARTDHGEERQHRLSSVLLLASAKDLAIFIGANKAKGRRPTPELARRIP